VKCNKYLGYNKTAWLHQTLSISEHFAKDIHMKLPAWGAQPCKRVAISQFLCNFSVFGLLHASAAQSVHPAPTVVAFESLLTSADTFRTNLARSTVRYESHVMGNAGQNAISPQTKFLTTKCPPFKFQHITVYTYGPVTHT